MGSCAFAHEESLGDTKSRLQTFDCLFQFAEDYASDTVLSSRLTKDVTSGYYYRYFDVTDSYLAVSEADNSARLSIITDWVSTLFANRKNSAGISHPPLTE